MRNYFKLMLTAIVLLLSSHTYAYEDWTSNNHAHGSSSDHTWNISVTAGQWITFDYSVSSEGGCDWLTVTVNGSQIVREAGEKVSKAVYQCTSTGTISIVATYSKDGSVNSGSDRGSVYNITVSDNEPEISIVLPQTKEIGVNVESQLSYELVPNSSGANISWQSSDDNIVTVDQTGKVKGIALGTATITASTNSSSSTCTVTVKPVESISFSEESVEFCLSSGYKSIYPNITPSYISRNSLSWASSNEGVVIVNDQGQLTLHSLGSSIITATATDGSNVSGSITVNVVPVSSITLVPKNISVGEWNNIEYTVLPHSADLSWSSSDESIVAVDQNGYITGKKLGTATITATSKDGVSGSCEITVDKGEAYLDAPFPNTNCLHLVGAYTPRSKEKWNYGVSYDGYSSDERITVFGLQSELDEWGNYQWIDGKINYEFTNDTYVYTTLTLASSNFNENIYLDGTILNRTNTYDFTNWKGRYIYKSEYSLFLKPGTHNLEISSQLYDGHFAGIESWNSDYTFAYADTTFMAAINNYNVQMDTIHVEREGILGAEALKLHANLSDFKGLVVSGPFDEYDWKTLNEMTNLICLDLSGVEANNYPEVWDTKYNLKALKLSEHIDIITKNPFNSTNLRYLFIPDNVKELGRTHTSDYGMNYSCLMYLDGCKGVEQINEKAFYRSAVVGDLNFPSLKAVGNSAFKECDFVESIDAPALISIGESAFQDMKKMKSINLEAVESIGNSAFKSTPITGDIVLNNLTSMGSNAFRETEINSFAAEKLEVVNKGTFQRSSLKFFSLPNCKVVKGSTTTTSYWNGTCEWVNGTWVASEGAFQACLIEEADLSNAEIIEDGVFMGCRSLTSLDIRRATTIGKYSFYNCNKTETINLSKAETIMQNAFMGCSNLKSINLPNVTSLGASAFENCHAATSINLSDKLTTIGDRSFYGCTNVENLTLPASLTKLPDYCFNGSNNIKTISLNAPAPPAVGETPFTMQTLYTATLRVPSASKGLYMADEYWKHFYYWDENPSKLEDLVLATKLTLGDIRMDKIRLYINPLASISMDGNESQAFRSVQFKANNSGAGMFLSNCERITSDETSAELVMDGLKWYFFTLPFNVSMQDIQNSESAQLAYYRYDGAKRATSGTGSSWVRMYDGTLTAGTGYIVQASKATKLTMPATYETKDVAFLPYDITTTLEANSSSNRENQGWNFIGNPYASYFNIAEMEFDAPITVWTGSTYTAYSVEDDDFALAPMQPFFVQCPAGVSSVKFNATGRQTTAEISHANEVKAMHIKSNAKRQVIDIVLSDEANSDRTRIVLNNNVTDEYDMTCDAAKMMSMEANVPQLYTVQNDVQYAINEGPHKAGVVEMGFMAPKAGSYTLRATRSDVKVILLDTDTDEQVELSEEGYTFEAEAGVNESRFQIILNTDEETAISAVSTESTKEIYDLTGKRLQQNSRGVNIIRKNGAVNKQLNR